MIRVHTRNEKFTRLTEARKGILLMHHNDKVHNLLEDRRCARGAKASGNHTRVREILLRAFV